MRILNLEDEPKQANLLRKGLTAQGLAADVATDGEQAMWMATATAYDAITLDVMLPNSDGFTLCRDLRRHGVTTPVLMITALDTIHDRVTGLDSGADDYLAKPFEPRELQARLRAILRRKGSTTKAETLRFGRLEIDKGARLVRIDGEERTITSYQFALLLALAERDARVLSRDAVMDLLKGEKLEAFDRSVDVHVSRIRAAIEDDPRHPRRILTVRGAGYVFARAQDDD